MIRSRRLISSTYSWIRVGGGWRVPSSHAETGSQSAHFPASIHGDHLVPLNYVGCRFPRRSQPDTGGSRTRGPACGSASSLRRPSLRPSSAHRPVAITVHRRSSATTPGFDADSRPYGGLLVTAASMAEGEHPPKRAEHWTLAPARWFAPARNCASLLAKQTRQRDQQVDAEHTGE